MRFLLVFIEPCRLPASSDGPTFRLVGLRAGHEYVILAEGTLAEMQAAYRKGVRQAR